MEPSVSGAEKLSHGFFGWLARVPFVPLVTVAITGALLVWVNRTTDDVLGIREYRVWISVAFIIALVLTLAQILHVLWDFFHDSYTSRTANADKHHRLKTMTPGEKGIVRLFLRNSRRTYECRRIDPSTISLVAADILTDKTPDRDDPDHFFVMAEWAWTYLNKHPRLTDGNKPENNLP